jgi:S1-C subfamily serine protease
MGKHHALVMACLVSACGQTESHSLDPAPVASASLPTPAAIDPNLGVPRCQPNAYEGIGAAPEVKGGVIVFTGLTRGGPAEVTGLRVGDVLTSVDGVPTAGQPFVEVHRWMLGAAGTRVLLGVERDGVPLTITIERARLKATC